MPGWALCPQHHSRRAHHQDKKEQEAVTWIVLLIIFTSIVYYLTVVFFEMFPRCNAMHRCQACAPALLGAPPGKDAGKAQLPTGGPRKRTWFCAKNRSRPAKRTLLRVLQRACAHLTP
jgi:hypothetical protein